MYDRVLVFALGVSLLNFAGCSNDESASPFEYEGNPRVEYGSLKDARDGQVYRTVTIGSQTWMAENLNYRYVGVKVKISSWTSDSSSWCYNNERKYCDSYGRLYTWSAVMDSAGLVDEANKVSNTAGGMGCGDGTRCSPNDPHRGVCPEGWHVPTATEFETLYEAMGGASTVAGELVKSTEGWNVVDSSNYNGTDEFGFSVLPAGEFTWDRQFSTLGYNTYLWTSTEDRSREEDRFAKCLQIYESFDNVSNSFGEHKDHGYSLRCLKDD